MQIIMLINLIAKLLMALLISAERHFMLVTTKNKSNKKSYKLDLVGITQQHLTNK